MYAKQGFKTKRFTKVNLETFLQQYCRGSEFQYLTVLLIWLVLTFDKEPDDKELAFLRSICDSWGVHFSLLSPLTREDSHDVIVATLSLVRNNVTISGKRTILEVVTYASLADSRVVYAELVLLHLISDAFAFSHNDLQEVYVSISGRPLPDLGDPSSIDFYKRRSSSSQSNSQSSSHSTNSTGTVDYHLTVLGLKNGTTRAEIRSQFHRLALLKHPDRAPNADAATKARLHEEFLTIKTSYAFLINYYA